MAVKAGVKRLCMFHSEHTYDDDTLESFLGETKDYLRIYAPESLLEIYLAYDGMELAL